MRILLIYPYHTSQGTVPARWYPAEPLGLMSIATYLSTQKARRDIDVRILDAQLEGPKECTQTERGWRSGVTDEQLQAYLEDYRPDVVGITNNYTHGCNDAISVAETARRVLPAACIVMGGAHATLDHVRLAAHPAVDYVARGEGELTFTELCLSLYDGRDLGAVDGLTYRAAGGVKQNAPRAPVANLDDLPLPDRAFVPYEKYLSAPQYIHTLQKPVATVFTSRGCPFKCVFCSTQKTWGNTWRGRSAAHILRELVYLRDNYGVREIAFQDDQLLGDRQRIIELCQLAVQHKLGLTFIAPPGMSPALMTPELLDWMKRAGFYRICFSVDVGSESAVKYVRTPVNLRAVRRLVRHANHRGLWTYGTFVIGFPFEDEANIRATIRYAYNLKLDFVRFYIAQPHFGSELYDRYLAEGRLQDTNIYEQHDIMDAFAGTDHLTAQQLIELRNEAECGYMRSHWLDFLNPVYLVTEFLPKINSWSRFIYFLGLVKVFFTFTIRFTKAPANTPAPVTKG